MRNYQVMAPGSVEWVKDFNLHAIFAMMHETYFLTNCEMERVVDLKVYEVATFELHQYSQAVYPGGKCVNEHLHIQRLA